MRRKSKKFRFLYQEYGEGITKNWIELNVGFGEFQDTIYCKLQVKERGKWMDVPFVRET